MSLFFDTYLGTKSMREGKKKREGGWEGMLWSPSLWTYFLSTHELRRALFTCKWSAQCQANSKHKHGGRISFSGQASSWEANWTNLMDLEKGLLFSFGKVHVGKKGNCASVDEFTAENSHSLVLSCHNNCSRWVIKMKVILRFRIELWVRICGGRELERESKWEIGSIYLIGNQVSGS